MNPSGTVSGTWDAKFPTGCFGGQAVISSWYLGFYGQAHSDALAMAYENFLMEIGLYGSQLEWNFDVYGHMATEATWFQNLWHYTSLRYIYHSAAKIW